MYLQKTKVEGQGVRGRRDEILRFRVTKHERQAIEEAVIRGGYSSVSDLLRLVIRKEVIGEKSN